MKLFNSAVLYVAVVLICGCDRSKPSPGSIRDIGAPIATNPFSLRRSAKPHFEPVEVPESADSIGMEFKWIPAGTFRMGSTGGGSNETPHEVTLTKPFKMGVLEVTQAQYEQVMGVNPSHLRGADHPVEHVNWNNAVEFCRVLSELPAEKAAGNVYRLPTEAEWEYACRAGTTTNFSFGDNETDLGAYACFGENYKVKTVWYRAGIALHHSVGGKNPNRWGLYDMHGNVAEWCQDWYGDYPRDAVTDTAGPGSGFRGHHSGTRVFRGGSWRRDAEACRSANRYRASPSHCDSDIGFRVSLNPFGEIYADFVKSAVQDRLKEMEGKVREIRKKIAAAENALRHEIEMNEKINEEFDYPAQYRNWEAYGADKYGSHTNAASKKWSMVQRLSISKINIEGLSDTLATDKFQLKLKLAELKYLNSLN